MSETTLSARLVKLRNEKGVSQDIAAEACSISRVTLARYENGTRIPVIGIAGKLAAYYGCTVDYLLGKTDDPNGSKALDDIKDAQISEFAEMFQQMDATDRESIMNLMKSIQKNRK